MCGLYVQSKMAVLVSLILMEEKLVHTLSPLCNWWCSIFYNFLNKSEILYFVYQLKISRKKTT